MRALPYAGQSFEAVISLDVLVHLEKSSEEHALREFARVLRPAGLLLLRVSALNVLRSRHSAFAHERQRFTRDRLAKSLRKVGLTPLRMTYANTLLLPVALLKFRILEPLMGAADESGVRPIPRWLNRSLQAVLQCETAWIASGRNFPLGQSLFAICRKDVG